MFKILFYSNYMLFDFELEKQSIDRISFKKFLAFPRVHNRQYHNLVIQKNNWLVTTKKNKHGDSRKTSLIALLRKQKREYFRQLYFCSLRSLNTKADNPRENEAKTRRSIDGTWTNKGGQSHIGCKLHCI